MYDSVIGIQHEKRENSGVHFERAEAQSLLSGTRNAANDVHVSLSATSDHIHVRIPKKDLLFLCFFFPVVICFSLMLNSLMSSGWSLNLKAKEGTQMQLAAFQSTAVLEELIGMQHNKNPPPPGCEATIMIIRHCEKDVLEEHCDYVGFERAHYLATLFGDDPGKNHRWPIPSYLYALSPDRFSHSHKAEIKRENMREVETVLPISEKFDIPIDSTYEVHTRNDLVRDLFQKLHSGEMCGKLALVSWKHSDIPKLAQKFGCGPLEGCPQDYRSKEFDQAWQIKFVYEIPRYKHLKKKKSKQGALTWKVFGSTAREGFDPLAFSHSVGDYDANGLEHGGNWLEYGEDWLIYKDASEMSL